MQAEGALDVMSDTIATNSGICAYQSNQAKSSLSKPLGNVAGATKEFGKRHKKLYVFIREKHHKLKQPKGKGYEFLF